MSDQHINNTVDWNEGGKVHNWRRYVPKHVREIWDSFTLDQQQALFQWADDLAMDEEWD